MTRRLKEGFRQRGYRFYLDSPTNQQFIILERGELKRLRGQVVFSSWEELDEDHTVVRFATSWATRPEDVDALMAILDG